MKINNTYNSRLRLPNSPDMLCTVNFYPPPLLKSNNQLVICIIKRLPASLQNFWKPCCKPAAGLQTSGNLAANRRQACKLLETLPQTGGKPAKHLETLPQTGGKPANFWKPCCKPAASLQTSGNPAANRRQACKTSGNLAANRRHTTRNFFRHHAGISFLSTHLNP